MPNLQLNVLGPLAIAAEGRPVSLGSRKAAALLVYLAANPEGAGRDHLATLFWPDQSQSRARAYLRNALWMLSQAGLEPWLDLQRESVALKPEISLDLAEFRQAFIQTGEHGHPPQEACPACIPLLEKMVRLYRGDFLEGFSLPDSAQFDEWQFFQADGARAMLAQALERLVAYYDRQEQWAEGLPHARRWVALDPLNEAAQRWLVRLYARGGSRSLALKQFETLRDTLERELGVEPEEESLRLYEEIRLPRAVKTGSASGKRTPPRNNLPADLTRFIGREREIAEICSALQPAGGARLLTLTGPGGSGKTRLAIKAASRLGEAFEDGIFFVGLAAVEHPDLAPLAISRALGLVEAPGRTVPGMLQDHLKEKKLLLILDNFEHLIPAAPLVSGLLAAAPGLVVLATSREVLHLYGEQVYPVPPLALPPAPDNHPPGDLRGYEAVQLFLDRAQAARPGSVASEQDLGLVSEICSRLDGLPLAIELAAARLKLFSLDSLYEQLGDVYALLRGGPRDVPDRQRTLRATIDWSFDLLDSREQRLFARFGVFHNSCTLEAFAAVCSRDDNLVAGDGLESLIEKSLAIQYDGPQGEPRYFMLETIRAYAREKLAAFGEEEETAGKHARYFAQLAGEAEPHLRGGPKIVYWLQRLESEHGNLRAALDRWFSRDPSQAMQMTGALLYFWIRQDHPSEGRRTLDRALSISSQAPPAVRAKLHLLAGILAYFCQELQACLAAAQTATGLYREAGDPAGTGWALFYTGGTLGMLYPERYDEGLALCDEGIGLLRTAGDLPGVAQGLNYVGEMARTRGDYPRAKAVYQECLAICQQTGDVLRELMIYQNLGMVALWEQDIALAEGMFRQALALCLRIHAVSLLTFNLQCWGGLYAAKNRPEAGARLMGAAQAANRAAGIVLQPADQIEVDRYEDQLRAMLGEAAYGQALREGGMMSMEEAVALAQEG